MSQFRSFLEVLWENLRTFPSQATNNSTPELFPALEPTTNWETNHSVELRMIFWFPDLQQETKVKSYLNVRDCMGSLVDILESFTTHFLATLPTLTIKDIETRVILPK